MKQLGKSHLYVSNQGLGCMSISEFYGKPLADSEGIELIVKAFENGINFFDTADVYAFGKNEILVGKAIHYLIHQKNVMRSELVVATKCGIIRDEFDVTKRGIDNSYAYIKSCCDKSLEKLGTEIKSIDLFYLHRIAQNGDQIDEAMRAMAELIIENKIQAVGLSEASPDVIRKANHALLKYTDGKHQLTAVQSEYSLLTRTVEKNGVLDTCRELGISFVAYSPLSRALLTNEIMHTQAFEKDDFRLSLPRFQDENFNKNKSIVMQVKEIADKKGCTVAQIALAWVMQQANVIPIPGTTKEKHLLSNIEADKVVLDSAELTILNNLEQPQGTRYAEIAMKAYSFYE